MRWIESITALALLCLGCFQSALAGMPFDDQLTQPLELKAPVRGTLAGDLGSLKAPTDSSQISKGSFQLPLPMGFPSARGGLGFGVSPSYSPSFGQSEWGMGFENSLSIYRYRESGSLDFQTDTLMSPWGLLVRGDQGDFLPRGLKEHVRVRLLTSGEILAFLPDGTTLKYGSEATVKLPRGIYAWYLTEAKTKEGLQTQYSYTANSSGALFLSEVLYAGRGGVYQYRIDLKYELTSRPLFSYRSTQRLEMDRRVTQVRVESLRRNTTFSEVYRYELQYQNIQLSPQFFLRSVQKIYPSGASEPPVTFSYNDGTESMTHAQWEHLPHLDPLLNGRGKLFAPDYSAQVDLNREGLASFETRIGFDLIRLASGSYSVERMPPADKPSPCRPFRDERKVPRQFYQMNGPRSEYDVVHLISEGFNTEVIACQREGALRKRFWIPGTWSFDRFARLVDLNQDGKPDLIRIFQGGYSILPNESDETQAYRFGEKRTGTLRPQIQPLGFWVMDMNGDGIPDLVVKGHAGIFIWYGKGNFEFETQAEYRSFKTASGQTVENLSQFSLLFSDVNHDGLIDILLTSQTNSQVFLNDGQSYVEKKLPLLEDKLGLRNSYPIVSDLKASGNTQIAIVQNDQAFVAELDTPSSGLLIGFDDGKGTTVHYTYERANPEPQLGQRAALLKSIEISSVGEKAVRTLYDYSSPKFHSQLKRFLGYEKVSSTKGNSIFDATFLHEDESPGLLASTLEEDQLSQVSRFARFGFQTQSFEGVSVKLPSFQEKGWTNSARTATVSSTRETLTYSEQLCPIQIREASTGGNLITQTQLTQVTAFSDHLQCLPSVITLSGQHTDSSFDFSHTLKLQYNEYAQPIEIRRVGTREGRPWEQVVQVMNYNRDGELVGLKVPGKGSTSYNYDLSHRLFRIDLPDGSITRVSEWDESLDLPLSQTQVHGRSSEYSQQFRYDPFGRVAAQWDNLGSGSESHPVYSYRYEFANSVGSFLGVIEKLTRSGLSDRFSASVAREVEFFSGAGNSLAQAREGDSGLSVMGIQTLDSESQISHRYGAKLLASRSQMPSLTLDELLFDAILLGYQQKTSWGYLVEEKQAIQREVFQRKTHSAELTPSGLKHTTVENSTYVTAEVLDEKGNRLQFTDEAGQTYFFHYDVLNRLRKIILPENGSFPASSKGLTHTVEYDSWGNVSFISREGVGSVGYQYDPATGLLVSKVYLDAQGAPVRSLSKVYDSVGRIVQDTYHSSSSAPGDSEVFTYLYDGKRGDGSKIEGQIGFLTTVRGPGFEKEFHYRSDGKILEQRLKLPGWANWITRFEYRNDGSLLKKTSEIEKSSLGKTPARKTSIDWVFDLDSHGRPSHVRISGSPILSFSYNEYSEVKSLSLYSPGSARNYLFGYDDWTHRRNSQTSEKVDQHWEWNNRGLIAQETLNQIRRSYSYEDPRGFLTSSQDSERTQDFTYDSVGMLLTTYTPGRSAVPFHHEVDSFGRVKSANTTQLSYNGQGRVSQVFTVPRPRVDYGYDENGIRIFKKVGGEIQEVYQGDSVYNGTSLYELLKVSGIWVDILQDGKPLGITLDYRGSWVADSVGKMNLPAAYGDRDQRPFISSVLDYASQGFDRDLGAYRMDHRDYDPVLKRFHTPDPLFLESPENCIRSPHECNLYGYAKGNPVSFVDPTGLLTIIVPGTHSAKRGEVPDWARLGSDFHSAVSKTFGEQAKVFVWNYGNNKVDRLEGAVDLAKMIQSHKLSPGEKVNIVSFSHGGNVTKEMTNFLRGVKIDNLINLGTPQRGDYQVDIGKVRNYTNVYSTGDMIQPIGGDLMGSAGRTDFLSTKQIELNQSFGHGDLHTQKAWSLVEQKL